MAVEGVEVEALQEEVLDGEARGAQMQVRTRLPFKGRVDAAVEAMETRVLESLATTPTKLHNEGDPMSVKCLGDPKTARRARDRMVQRQE